MSDRREFLKKSLLAGAGLTLLGSKMLHSSEVNSVITPSEGEARFKLEPLPYAYDDLEPYIDKMTMEIHHSKHHQAYVNNLNKALDGERTGLVIESLESLLSSISQYSVATRNNAGGHWNHTFFWNSMRAPLSGGQANEPGGKFLTAINTTFGDFSKFKDQFAKAGKDRFGSGWAWLVKKDGALIIGSTPNQDNPLMDISELKGTPLLGLDVWEHAYYLKYQNLRADYINNWWNVVNWDVVSKRYESA